MEVGCLSCLISFAVRVWNFGSLEIYVRCDHFGFSVDDEAGNGYHHSGAPRHPNWCRRSSDLYYCEPEGDCSLFGGRVGCYHYPVRCLGRLRLLKRYVGVGERGYFQE